MKLNLIIRTYVVDNLYTSLFDVPNKIKSDNVELFVHNDNPDVVNEFNSIISEFIEKFPSYKITTIQETENQQMFISFFNTIPYLNDANIWTMLLDDDDTLQEFTEEIIETLFKFPLTYQVVYQCLNFDHTTGNVKTMPYLHCINPTHVLKYLYTYLNQIKELLIKFTGNTKFSTSEDYLIRDLVRKAGQLERYYFRIPLITHNFYDHNINGYCSGPNCRDGKCWTNIPIGQLIVQKLQFSDYNKKEI